MPKIDGNDERTAERVNVRYTRGGKGDRPRILPGGLQGAPFYCKVCGFGPKSCKCEKRGEEK